MIQKLKLLKNTGKFYDFSAKGNGLDWHKNTFLFAPNAYGKSTLVNVFRSLRDNAPKIMRARKTVNASTTQEAVNLKQLCVFTHKKDFLGMLFDKMPENCILQIKSDKKNGSRLEPFDVEEDRKSALARLLGEMERYLTEDFGTPDVMQGNIRKVIEIVLKTKYYRTLLPDIKSKKGLAKLLETLFSKNLLSVALKPTLFNLCNLSNGSHHGEIVELPERQLTRDELLPLIHEAFENLEKV